MSVQIADLKDWLGVSQGDTNAERRLGFALAAANQAVADYCNRTFTVVTDDTAVSTRTFDAYNRYEVFTDDIVGEVTSVQDSNDRSTWTTRTGDVTWLEPANETVRYWLRSTRPFGRWVKVTAKFGVTAELAALTDQPTLLWAARLYQRHKTVSGVEGFDGFGIRITAADRDVTALLDPLCRGDRMGIA